MASTANIRALFCDVGGVLLTNGWDTGSRQLAADAFGVDPDVMQKRHSAFFDAYELGHISLQDYLRQVVFHEPRSFTPEEFADFMYSRSEPHADMIDVIRGLRARHGLRVIAVSNEGRELMEYRSRTFGLADFIDATVCSAFVGMRKPNPSIYRLAIDLAQIPPDQILYIEDRSLQVEAGEAMGLRGLHHTSTESTVAALAKLGLTV